MSYSETLKVGNSYNEPVKEYICDSIEAMNLLPKNIPSGSKCQVLLEDGKLYNFIYVRESKDEDGTWINDNTASGGGGGSGSGDMLKAIYDSTGAVSTAGGIVAYGNANYYKKPSSGIPKTDLASAVQTSLGKADTALQSYTETDPTVPSWAKASTKPSYTASEVGALPDTTVIPQGTVTSVAVKMNGEVKGTITESGTIDLGTVSTKGSVFTVSLSAGGWTDNEQEVSNTEFVASGYSYIVSYTAASRTAYIEAGIYAADTASAGSLTFYCDTTPTADITVLIQKIQVATNG